MVNVPHQHQSNFLPPYIHPFVPPQTILAHATHYISTHITTTQNLTVLYLFSVLDTICCNILYSDDGHIDV
jgi:hypothetical protein